jgi:hypothetical protein
MSFDIIDPHAETADPTDHSREDLAPCPCVVEEPTTEAQPAFDACQPERMAGPEPFAGLLRR